MNDQLINLKTIINTLKLMTITSTRMQDHATIVGNGELALELDTLLLQVQNVGIVADGVMALFADNTDTQEFPVVAAS
jgi:hypothetical protein